MTKHKRKDSPKPGTRGTPGTNIHKATTRRPTWDEYFLKITREVAQRSTCLRRQVGALLVLDKRILATGYNGAPKGLAHCLDIGCLREKLGIPPGERQELCRGLHAEMNALLQAASYGIQIGGATLYTTNHPCITCAKMLINCGVRRIVALDDYPDGLSKDILKEAGVRVEIVKPHKS
ncbi:MAG TPA: deoxycytidylate deaminase [Candidatus Tripitaka californicus]|uniref:deoxycytidylate deaminase n=1 Tax=Candidatus Tripitaka californicus TaxID=3367616 RepID=UPI0040276520|nr:cytidine/deoxycytidylate deaminase family protein [Planctomycetota bacterium]